MKQLSLALFMFTFFLFTGCHSPSLMGKKVKNTYFTGGQISSKFIMDDNTGQNGILKKYGYNGHITSIVPIHNGVKDGVETGFDEKGRRIWSYNYVNGKLHGTQYAYYPNGDVMISYNFLNGIKDGIARTYNIDGTVNRQVTYAHGKIIN